MKIAVCIFDTVELSIDNKNLILDNFYQKFNSHPTIFCVPNDDVFKSLWLTNHQKRQTELNSKELFDVVVFSNIDMIGLAHTLNIRKPDPSTLYYYSDTFISLCFSDSISSDLTSLYYMNRGYCDSLQNDFYYHVKSYKLNTAFHNKVI